jgi:hypothetical protein
VTVTHVWIAVENTWAGLEVQPAASREAALRWLTTRVVPAEWANYARREDRPAGEDLDTDPAKVDPMVLLSHWHGPVDEDTEDVLSFGLGEDNHAYIARKPVFGADE